MNITVTISPRTLFAILGIVFATYFIWQIPDIIALLLISLILAAAMRPGVEYFQHRLRLKRPYAVMAIYGIALGILGLLLLIIVPVFIVQSVQLAQALPTYGELAQHYLSTVRTLGIPLPQMGDLANLAAKQASGWLQSTLSYTFRAFELFVRLFGIIITTFFLLTDSERIRDGFLRLIPQAYRQRIGELIQPVSLQLGAYVRGQLTVVAIFATYLAITLSIARIPFSLVLALLAGLFDIVPMLGIIGIIPTVLIALTVSWKHALAVVIIYALGNFIEGNILSPMILSKQVNVPPILIFFALLIGAQFMGLVGALLAVPMTAALLVVVKMLYLPAVEANSEG